MPHRFLPVVHPLYRMFGFPFLCHFFQSGLIAQTQLALLAVPGYPGFSNVINFPQ